MGDLGQQKVSRRNVLDIFTGKTRLLFKLPRKAYTEGGQRLCKVRAGMVAKRRRRGYQNSEVSRPSHREIGQTLRLGKLEHLCSLSGHTGGIQKKIAANIIGGNLICFSLKGYIRTGLSTLNIVQHSSPTIHHQLASADRTR